jgi:hypothetical protein
VSHFETFVEEDNWSYTYSYQINYTGESRTYESDPVETDENILTIGIGDIGILDVKVRPGDLDFEQVRQALVTMHYEDGDAGIGPLEQQFILAESDDVHRFQQVIFDQVTQPYEYKVKYFMDSGKELETEWREARTPDLYIGSAFSSTRTISLRAGGDLENDISNIFLDLTYTDEENDYVQETSIALNQNNTFFDWTIPVIKEQGGAVTYAGTIQFRDGTADTVAETEMEGNTLVIPKVADLAEIQVRPDLLDFDEVEMCVVTLTYRDEENDVFATQEFVFTPTENEPQTWQLQLKDAAKTEYEWQARFFLADGSSRTAGPEQESQRTLVLRLPEE